MSRFAPTAPALPVQPIVEIVPSPSGFWFARMIGDPADLWIGEYDSPEEALEALLAVFEPGEIAN